MERADVIEQPAARVVSFKARSGRPAPPPRLVLAAEDKIACEGGLRSCPYIPEVYSDEQRDAINVGRISLWSQAVAIPGKQQLILTIAKIKEITPARYGLKAVVKHVPAPAFMPDEQIYRRLARRLEHGQVNSSAAEN